MINLKKYALAAALVIPSALTLTAKDSEAAKIVIDKDLAQGVNVRSEAKIGDNIMGLINDNEKSYEIKGEEGEWLKIDFNGKDAYVVARWFHILGEDKVVADANFRTEPNLDSEVIRVLKAGEEVEVVEVAENGYVKVTVGEEEGYIYHNLLEEFRKANEAKQAAANKAQASKQAPAQQQSAPVAQAQTQTYQQPAQQQTYQQPVQQQQTYQGSSNWAKEWIAQRESNGSYTAYNPNGGYYGRYQLNPSLIHYGASPAEQEAAADAYVAQRYGSWEAAQAFWAANGLSLIHI